MKISKPHIPSDLKEVVDAETTLLKDESLSELWFNKSDLSGVQIRSIALNESKLTSVNLAQAKLEKTAFLDVVIEGSSLVATNFTDSGWRSMQIIDSRCSGAQFQMRAIENAMFKGCKLDLANFRFAKLKNVIFRDCLISDTDFYNAELTNVHFDKCNIEKIELSGTKNKNLDLRSSQLGSIHGSGSLKGAIIDSMQLMQLAPYLAQEIGLTIKD